MRYLQFRKPKVSIVIPSFNSIDLFDCIYSVLDQDYLDFEIIVIDNSTDECIWKGLINKYDSNEKIKLIKTDKNLGVTGGRNLGIKYSDNNSKYILFLDHDIILERNTVSELVKIGEIDSTIGIVTGKIFFFDDPKRLWAAGTSINLITGMIFLKSKKNDRNFNKIIEVQVAPSIILTKKSVIDKIEGFDDEFFANYEDTDFCFRTKKAGFKIFYTPNAIAYHKITSNLDDANNRLLTRAYYIARNKILFMRLHSNYFIIFIIFIPVYVIYYGILSIKLNRIDAIKEFLSGTISGLFYSKRSKIVDE